jgi:hypothetical protein
MAASRRASKTPIKPRSRFRSALVVLFSVAALVACGLGFRAAILSPLFYVQVVEVSEVEAPEVPIDAAEISRLAAVPLGKQSLFELDLASVEKRVLAHPWVREVKLQKRFPQTLAVSVVARDPRALLQKADGSLAYLDQDGQDFSRVDLAVRSDLPVISVADRGLDPKADRQRIVAALELAAAWSRGGLGRLAPLSSIDYHPERGFRAWVSYSTGTKKTRAYVNLGSEVDRETLESRLTRLESVFSYLSLHSISVRHVWADAGKKIVVKIARGS